MAPASRKLRESLERQLGPDEAGELLNLIPPDWTQLATKHDVAVLGSELRSEMANLRTELKTDMANLRTELRTDMADLRTELKTDMADLRTELKTDMAMLRSEFGDLKGQFGELTGQFGKLTGDFGRLEGTLHKELRKQTIIVVASMLTMVSFATGLAGLIITFGPPA